MFLFQAISYQLDFFDYFCVMFLRKQLTVVGLNGLDGVRVMQLVLEG